MASILPDVLARLTALMDGTASPPPRRSIPSGRFERVEFDVGSLLQRAVSAPYPYEIEDLGEFQPLEVPSTLAGDQVWHGVRWTVRVAYATSPLASHDRLATVMEDRYAIRRCLGDPMSWLTLSGVASVRADEGSIGDVEIIGYGGSDDVDVMKVLEITLEIIFREDQS